jgi:hypothetical protein
MQKAAREIFRLTKAIYDIAGPGSRAVLGVGVRPLSAEIVNSNPTGDMDVCLL